MMPPTKPSKQSCCRPSSPAGPRSAQSTRLCAPTNKNENEATNKNENAPTNKNEKEATNKNEAKKLPNDQNINKLDSDSGPNISPFDWFKADIGEDFPGLGGVATVPH